MEHTYCGHLTYILTIPIPDAAIGKCSCRPRLLEVMQAPKRRQPLPARWSLSTAVDPDCQHCLQEGRVDGREELPLSMSKLWIYGLEEMLGQFSPEGAQCASSHRSFRRICRPDHLVFSSQSKADWEICEADLRTECMIDFNQSLQT